MIKNDEKEKKEIKEKLKEIEKNDEKEKREIKEKLAEIENKLREEQVTIFNWSALISIIF